VYQWCGFKSRRGKNKKLTVLKSNSNTVWFNFQTYIYIYMSQYQSYFQLVSKTQINNFYIFWLKLPTIFFIYSDNIHTYLIWTTYSVIDTDSYIYIYIYIRLKIKPVEWSRDAGRKAKWMVLQCINGVGSNLVEGRTKNWQL
jgi:hypothetical protein